MSLLILPNYNILQPQKGSSCRFGFCVRSMANKPVVLLVDDKTLVLELLVDVLQDHFDTVTASNGLIALKKFRALQTVNGVITDLQMPFMDGLEMVRHLRSLNPMLPVLILSGTTDYHKEVKGLFENVEVIAKPFEVANLLDIATQLFVKKQTPDRVVASGCFHLAHGTSYS